MTHATSATSDMVAAALDRALTDHEDDIDSDARDRILTEATRNAYDDATTDERYDALLGALTGRI
ncbi:hypothetical protein KI372_12660, partial [Halobacterium salinarum]|nr:hypothetical protein [Halobacterium salinarum]